MTDARQVRLLGLLLVVIGGLGLIAATVGWYRDNEATGWFAVALAVGIAAIIWKRPRTKEAQRRG